MKIPMVAGKPFGALTVTKSLDGHAFDIIRPHPSVPDSKYGTIVARVGFSTVDGEPTEETEAYARLFAAAPRLLELTRLRVTQLEETGVALGTLNSKWRADALALLDELRES